MHRSSKLDNGGAIQFVSKRGQDGIRVWFAGNFTNSIMRTRLLTRLSNASVRNFACVGKKRGNFRFQETDDYWHVVETNHNRSRQRNPSIYNLPLRGERNRFASDLHNSAWTLVGFCFCIVESCVLKGEERLMGRGWITIHRGIYGSEKRKKRGRQMHAIRGEVSFSFSFFFF